LDQDYVRALLSENWLECREDGGGRLRQALAWAHEIQVVVWCYAEDFQDLVEEFAVLSGGAGADGESACASKGQDDRGQLDRLGAGPEND
jgi:hypothetical protein